MPTSLGHQTKAGFKREAIVYAPTWPAASPIVVDALLPMMSENIDETLLKAPDITLDGGAAMTASDVIGKRSNGTMPFQARYQGMEFLFAACLGFQAKRISSIVMPEQLAVGAHRHLFELDDTLATTSWLCDDGFICDDGPLANQKKVRRGTLAVDKQVSIWEFLSAMVNRLTIRGTPERVEIELDFVAYNRDLASAINTSAVFDALTSDNHPNILFTDLVARIGDYSASVSLGAGDVVGITSFEIVVDNGLASDDQSTNTGNFIEEPERNAKAVITGSFNFARYVDDNFLSDLSSDTSKMADLKFTGGQIGATGQNYALNLYLSNLTFDQVQAPTPGASLTQVAHTFTAYKPSGIPSGFPTSLKNGPLMVEVQSAESSHVLL